ncbi:MAG TPA: phosphodiester glycosidase family protein [Polyangiaceae bacterium]|nr:phosphodiester glycosidase family protein [Polyangiaceae bacterium]
MPASATFTASDFPAQANATLGVEDTLPPSAAWSAPVAPTRARRRFLVALVAAGAGALFATWTATRTLPWFGPLLADSLRSLVGSEAVTRLEETTADLEDRVQQVQQAVGRSQARTLDEATPSDLLAVTAKAPSAPAGNRPSDVGPMFAATAGSDDGAWQPARVRTTDDTLLYRTIVHPDPERLYSELFVFALDLSRLKVHAVAGSVEPKSLDAGPSVARPGVIPEADREHLVAAFNGGFKAEHGRFGMMVDGAELLAPRPTSCTFAADQSGGLTIKRWTALSNQASRFAWWRQTPGCMVEGGALHPGLAGADSKNWGATLEGKTVIRRSAVGLSKDGHTLFVGISNSTTARALATGMQHAGAVDVAQLDVNFSFPRFLLYREAEGTGELSAFGAVKGQLYERDEYLGHASTRDFFYVTAD